MNLLNFHMSTASLRRDHELIEKVIKAMEAKIQLLIWKINS